MMSYRRTEDGDFAKRDLCSASIVATVVNYDGKAEGPINERLSEAVNGVCDVEHESFRNGSSKCLFSWSD